MEERSEKLKIRDNSFKELANVLTCERAEVIDDEGDIFLSVITKEVHIIALKPLIAWIKKYRPELLK